MLHYSYYQESLFHVEPKTIGLAENSIERWLPELMPKLFSSEDFAAFYKTTLVGQDTCDPILLTAMLVLQFLYNVSDRELVSRCRRDLGWHHALRIEHPSQVPSVSSIVRFRSKIRREKGDDFVHQTVLKFLCNEGVIDDTQLQAIDSTNTDCRGAVIDTYNLIAACIKQVLRSVSQCMGQNVTQLSTQWGVDQYLCRSIKGQVSIDWHDEQARNSLLTEEIHDAQRLKKLVAEQEVTFPPSVEQALELLEQVAYQDVEEYEPGKYRMAKGTSKNRVVSATDPEARHGRKSSSKAVTGFKMNVLGTIESQFVTGIHITDAGVHDSKATGELIEQSERNNVKPERAVGDAAYGTGENIRECNERGVQLLSKETASSHKDVITKREFEIDLDRMEVTCPAGQSTAKFTMVKAPEDGEKQVPKFHFAKETCNACPLNQKCDARTRKGYSRQIRLSLYEQEHQSIKAFNSTEESKGILRSRCAIERLISHLVKMGMRHARFFGMHMVQFQAYMTAAAYNLQRYIRIKLA